MRLRHVVSHRGYHQVRVAGSDDNTRVYKDRVRLNLRVVGDGVIGLVHEGRGSLQEGDLIEAEGETLTLTVEPYDPHQQQTAPLEGRRIETVGLAVTETIKVGDGVS